MTWGDGLVLVVTLALVALSTTLWQGGGPAHEAHIKVVGGQSRVVSLLEDQQFNIKGRLGDSHMEISAGRIRFSHSPCQGKQCILSGWLEQAGDFAACLPNGISIQLVGKEPALDAVNF